MPGIFLGGGLCRLRWKTAFVVAAGIFLALPLLAVSLSYYTNYWFPWLIIAGGQVPCALAWTAAMRIRRAPASAKTLVLETLPETPGYELFHPPFAEGAYGKVWLARNAAGQWLRVESDLPREI